MDGQRVKEVEDNRGREKITQYSCPKCRLILFAKPNFCGQCGTYLLWPAGLNRGLYTDLAGDTT